MRKKSFKNKITYIKPIDCIMLCIIFVMFIVLLVALGICTNKSRNNQLLVVDDSMHILAYNQKVQFEEYIDEKIALLQGIAGYPQIYEMNEEDQNIFIRNHSKLLGFHHLFVVRKDGTVLYPEENRKRNQKNEPFINDVMRNDVFITEPFYGADVTTITVSVSIYNGNQKVGALCGAVELSGIMDMFNKNQMYMDGSSYLINSEGFFLAADKMHEVYNKERIYEKLDSTDDKNIISDVFLQKRDKSGIVDYEGQESLINITYLADFDWAIVQRVKTEDIYSGLQYIIYIQYAAMLIVITIFFYVIRILLYWNKSNTKNVTDSLTGCYSRLAMLNLIDQLNTKYKDDIAIVYLDLNRFKAINDTLGHDMGDKVLCIFSNVLVEVFGDRGDVGRLGGDEFMVILINCPEEEILKCCEKTNRLLMEGVKSLDLPVEVDTSYGLSIRRKGSKENLNIHITKADERMYEYKESHR